MRSRRARLASCVANPPYGREVRPPQHDLLEEVYIVQPPWYVAPGMEEEEVLRLHKVLYGLHQAPRAWNTKLDESLVSLGLEGCPLEHAVYR